MADGKPDEGLLFAEFLKHFTVHFSLLLRRYERFRKINTIGNNDIDVITYFDMIVVQLRAMCIENDRYTNNYTAQILLRKVGEEALAQRIDDMLKEHFDIGFPQVDIRTALKILADEFVCHYDNFDSEDRLRLPLADIIMRRLRNPYAPQSLDYIMETLINCIGQGLNIRIGETEDVIRTNGDKGAPLKEFP